LYWVLSLGGAVSDKKFQNIQFHSQEIHSLYLIVYVAVVETIAQR
jgi:hypothetical protein